MAATHRFHLYEVAFDPHGQAHDTYDIKIQLTANSTLRCLDIVQQRPQAPYFYRQARQWCYVFHGHDLDEFFSNQELELADRDEGTGDGGAGGRGHGAGRPPMGNAYSRSVYGRGANLINNTTKLRPKTGST